MTFLPLSPITLAPMTDNPPTRRSFLTGSGLALSGAAVAAASILGDEAMHWAVLRQALGEEPVPAAFVS
jgi:hypothetical protein